MWASWSGATSRSASAASIPRRAGSKLFEVRESERDVSFLRRFLTEDLMPRARPVHVEAAGRASRRLRGRGRGALGRRQDRAPAADRHAARCRRSGSTTPTHKGRRGLYLVHDHDGRDLDMTHADKTLHHLRTLWGRDTYPADLRPRQEDADERYRSRLRREAGELTHRIVHFVFNAERGVEFACEAAQSSPAPAMKCG